MGGATAKFRETEEQYKALKERFSRGEVTADFVKDELKRMMMQDDNGTYWMVGGKSGKWYRHNGSQWEEADPYEQKTAGTDHVADDDAYVLDVSDSVHGDTGTGTSDSDEAYVLETSDTLGGSTGAGDAFSLEGAKASEGGAPQAKDNDDGAFVLEKADAGDGDEAFVLEKAATESQGGSADTGDNFSLEDSTGGTLQQTDSKAPAPEPASPQPSSPQPSGSEPAGSGAADAGSLGGDQMFDRQRFESEGTVNLDLGDADDAGDEPLSLKDTMEEPIPTDLEPAKAAEAAPPVTTKKATKKKKTPMAAAAVEDTTEPVAAEAPVQLTMGAESGELLLKSIKILSLLFFLSGLGVIIGVLVGATFGIFEELMPELSDKLPMILRDTRGGVAGGLMFATIGGIAGFIVFALISVVLGGLYNLISFIFGGLRFNVRRTGDTK